MDGKILKQLPVRFANYQEINETVSKVKIYVMYAGENRNGSFMSKESVEKAIPSLRGVPVVGEYKASKENFGDHGGKVVIDSDGIEFIDTTKPVGFVEFDETLANIQWETIEDRDGKEVEYLVCDAYLWRKRYPEVDVIFNKGANQSMEINVNDYEFDDSKKVYNIKDFTFDALCVLGYDSNPDENVEPCFEDAKIVSYGLNKDEFKLEFTQMVKEIKESFAVVETEEVAVESDPTPENFEAEEKSEVEVETEVVEVSMEEVETVQYKKRQFELSFNDIESKIYALVNGYDEDGYMNYDFWICEMFETYAIVHDYNASEYYKISYTVENDEVMIGEKVKVYSVWLTEDEKSNLETMKSEYANYKQAEIQAIEAELAAQKDELFEKYDELMLDNEEYNKVKEAKSDYSFETLESTLALIYVKSTLNFSSKVVKKYSIVKLGKEDIDNKPVVDPYGGLFNKN